MKRFAAPLALAACAVATLYPAAAMSLHGGPTADRRDIQRVNVIDGGDGRGSLLDLGPGLGLSADEIARIRKASGYVGCFLPSPAIGTGALFLSSGQILTAAHIFFEPTGGERSKCFFKSQSPGAVRIDLDLGAARFGAVKPKPGSNDDYAIVRLVTPIAGAEPFPVASEVPVKPGDRLVLVSAHPADMETTVDNAVPVVQGCTVRRVPKSTAATSFFRTDCDATGGSSGSIGLARVGGRLVFRGIAITTGPWRDPHLKGAPYDEGKGSVTTLLGCDAAILAAGTSLAAEP